MEWKEVSAERFDEMLNILPPGVWNALGFLVGEPVTHRICTISNQFAPTFTVFTSYRGKYFEDQEPITVPEFEAINQERRLRLICPSSRIIICSANDRTPLPVYPACRCVGSAVFDPNRPPRPIRLHARAHL
jgi:hypothetical protein